MNALLSVRSTYSTDGLSVNGWNVTSWGLIVTAGKKLKDNIEINICEASISTYEEIEDIEFPFSVYDANSFDKITEINPVVIVINE